MSKKLSQNFKMNLFCCMTFPVCVMLSIFIFSLLNNFPNGEIFKNFLVQAHTKLYQQHHNIIPAPYIANINFYRYLYYALFLNFILLYFIKKIFKSDVFKIKQSLMPPTLSLLFTVYIFVIFIQTLSLSLHAHREYVQFSGKSTDQKYGEILKSIYILPQRTKKLFPGYHKAELITDLNLTEDPGQLYYRQMAYFLYPIDIRGIHKHADPDLALIFFKQNAIAHVPDGYKPRYIFDNKNLIAIKIND